MNKVEIFGYGISATGLERDVEEALSWIENRNNGRYMACANPHSLVVASRDAIFKKALRNADILVPDGTGIVLASKVLASPVTEKVAGYDFFMTLTKKAQHKGGLRYFFLGSSDNVLGLIRSRLAKEFPAITVSGTYSPPFKETFSDAENEEMVRSVKEAGADVLWVGMTAPKQEKWIYVNRDRLQMPFIGAIGAVFDFYAGTKVRSSVFWQKLGLEWLPRFVNEPVRLWERNIKSTPIFLGWVIREKYRQILGLV
jgi:N-acetylglucosaminyldiphosphoundecaprenol N-acetyl-beta-D-mannosaminyltransferase